MESAKKIQSKGLLSTRIDYVLHRIRFAVSGLITRLINPELLLRQFVGILFAVVIYFLAIHQIDMIPLFVRKMLLTCFVLVTSLTMVFLPSTSRCFLTLVVFNFFSSAGKIFLTSIVLRSILHGSVNNTMRNIERTMASFKCQSDLVKNVGQMMNKRGLAPKNRELEELRQVFKFNLT